LRQMRDFVRSQYEQHLANQEPLEETQLVDYLLSPWEPEQQPAVKELRERGASALELILQEGVDQAMNILNRRENFSRST